MRIYYPNEEAFYNGILELVKRGLTFNAYETQLMIELSGGF